MRTAAITRNTKETQIKLEINLDAGSAQTDIQTGIGFFDHMLTAMAFHGGFGLTLKASGDLQVDCHHTVEDCGIVLGQAYAKAIGDRAGIARYGTMFVPMDEALAHCALDISGRGYCVCNAIFNDEKVGDFETATLTEFFRAFAHNAGITLHVTLNYGDNDHHSIEAMFKAVGQSLRQAARITGNEVFSTKGVL